MKIFELLFRPFRKLTRSDRSLSVKKEVSKKSEFVVKKGVSYMSDEADKISKSVKRDVPRTTFTKEEAGAVRFKTTKYYPEDLEKMKNMTIEEEFNYKLHLQKIGRVL